MSEYWILGADYDQHGKITACRTLQLMPTTNRTRVFLSELRTRNREEILNLLSERVPAVHALYVATREADTLFWQRGVPVHLTPDRDFITTLAAATKSDSLGELPTCAELDAVFPPPGSVAEALGHPRA